MLGKRRFAAAVVPQYGDEASLLNIEAQVLKDHVLG